MKSRKRKEQPEPVNTRGQALLKDLPTLTLDEAVVDMLATEHLTVSVTDSVYEAWKEGLTQESYQISKSDGRVLLHARGEDLSASETEPSLVEDQVAETPPLQSTADSPMEPLRAGSTIPAAEPAPLQREPALPPQDIGDIQREPAFAPAEPQPEPQLVLKPTPQPALQPEPQLVLKPTPQPALQPEPQPALQSAPQPDGVTEPEARQPSPAPLAYSDEEMESILYRNIFGEF